MNHKILKSFLDKSNIFLYILPLLFKQKEDCMPQHKSAVKRIRQNQKRRERNVQKRSMMRTALKKIKNAPDQETAQNELKRTASILDRLAIKRIIHPNKAANLKSKLTRHVNNFKAE
jgi:small subunit ribosomal protein S20